MWHYVLRHKSSYVAKQPSAFIINVEAEATSPSQDLASFYVTNWRPIQYSLGFIIIAVGISDIVSCFQIFRPEFTHNCSSLLYTTCPTYLTVHYRLARLLNACVH